jgi:hypothetical protein
MSNAPMSHGLKRVVKRYTLLSSNDAMDAKLPAWIEREIQVTSEAGVQDRGLRIAYVRDDSTRTAVA